MPQVLIPSANRQFAGIFPGEFAGNFYLAKNVDLHRNPGQVLVGESLSSKFNNANLTLPIAFIRTAADGTDKYWALGGKLFKTAGLDPQNNWVQDAIANSPSAPVNDMVELVSNLYVPTATDISRLVAGTWTASWWQGTQAQTALTSNPHRFEIFAGAWLLTDGRLIHTWDNTIVVNSAITLPSNFIAQWIRSTANFAIIGTKNNTADEAEIFFWDRTSATFNARYGIGDREALAGFVVAGIPYVITKRGEIKRFTGQGFRTVNQFPSVELYKDINNIDPNGIVVQENIVKILVDFGTLSDLRLLSGIWTFDASTNNLYHSNSFKNAQNKDYSQQEIAGAGALRATQPGQGRFLVGGTAYTAYPGSTSTNIYTFDEDNSINRGYILLSKIRIAGASNRRAKYKPIIRGFFTKVFLKYRRFKSSGDRIRVLIRTTESNFFPEYETITWLTSTTFTSNSTTLKVDNFVEVLAGDNAGALAKITAKNGTTYTIDLTLNTSTSTSRVRYLDFLEVGTLADQDTQSNIFRLGARSEWVQILLELRGTRNSPSLEQTIIDFNILSL